jgi:uncharacterized OsmC-like protein
LLWSQARGEIEKDGKVLVIKRIHVTYHLKAGQEQQETVNRVYGVHTDFCPVYRTVKDSIQITTELVLES